MMGYQLSRRELLLGSAALVGGSLVYPVPCSRAAQVKEVSLIAAPRRLPIVGGAYPETDVWSYAGEVPGPEIRVRQGERLRVRLENRLPASTTIHWHGVRVPNAMDGVPHLTQRPIEPGETFIYEFDCVDAGTFWYHPHQRSNEQVERGLYGALIVEEPEPFPVDRDVTWVLDDWRLLQDASISDDFGNMHDASHNGRIGNTVTVNGRLAESFGVRPGERIRLRLINAANARIFGLNFLGHQPIIIALDGQPITPHTPPGGRVVLAPAMRVDVILQMKGVPGNRYQIQDNFYRGIEYRLIDLVYGADAPTKNLADTDSLALVPNPLPEPDLNNAERHQVYLAGGMMGSMRSAKVDGRTVDLRGLFESGLAWAMNGVSAKEHIHEPLLRLSRNRSYIVELINDTQWHHPMHLHGHSFRVVTRNGQATTYREWQDTVLMSPRERLEIAFVADNPGHWMFHCHILEHQMAGMMGTVIVS